MTDHHAPPIVRSAFLSVEPTSPLSLRTIVLTCNGRIMDGEGSYHQGYLHTSSPEHFNLWQTLYQTTWRHLSFDKSAQVSVSLTGKLSLSSAGTSCIALFPASSNRFEFSWLAPKRFKILETEFDTCDDAEWTTTALGMLADTAVGFAECWRCNSRANRRRSLFSGSCRMAFRSSRRFRWALLRRYRPIGSSLSIFSSVLPEYNALPEASAPRGAMPWCRSMRGSP